MSNERQTPTPTPTKPKIDEEARRAWLDAMKSLPSMKPPEELPPLKRAWVSIYAAAISGGASQEYAALAADYGLVKLRHL